MGGSPAFQFYAQDFLNGTGTMSNAEVGAYIRMLAWSWNNGPLPVDEHKLARVIVDTVPQLRRLWLVVGSKWKRDGDGWVNERLERVRSERDAYVAKQVAAGIASAAARQQKANQNATVVEPPLQPPLQPDTQPDRQPTPQPNANSSIFDLQSSEKDPHRKERGGDLSSPARASSIALVPVDPPRSLTPFIANDARHLRCPAFTWDACARGICVPRALHAEWIRQLGADSQDFDASERAIGALVEKAISRLRPGPIGDTPYAFWRAVWAAEHAPQAPAAQPSATTKGNQSVAAMSRVLAARREQP